jgi:hypothetical protein
MTTEEEVETEVGVSNKSWISSNHTHNSRLKSTSLW